MSDLLRRHRDAIAPVINFDTDIIAERAQGIWVYDKHGNRFADFACGTAVTNLGHNHPKVVAAAHEQLDRFMHSGCIFRYEALVELAEQLRDITPPRIDKFAFANSGSEAVEAAVKLAKKTTHRQGVVVFRGGFHGRTMGSVTYTTSNATYRDGYHPLLGSVFVVPFPHPYRWGKSDEEATDYALEELEFLFNHQVRPHDIACFLIEPQQGEGGYYPAPPRFLEELRGIADQHGILLVFDEVQTGFGRTAAWFGADHYQPKPDIIAVGKGIANGLPLSGYGANSERIDSWPKGSHGTTFGGNPVACAAALAVIDTLRELLPHAVDLAGQALERLGKLAADHPTVGDVRGLGLMVGIELVENEESRTPDPQAFAAVQRYCLDNGLIIIDCGPSGNIIRFIPPLVSTAEELDWAIDLIDQGLAQYEGR